MKTKLYIFTIVAVLLGTIACDPIEDKSLRDEFAKTGTPVTGAELTAALSVTQPIPNSDDKVEGDQYVVLNNVRKDIPGTWFVETSIGLKTYHTDHDTIVYTDNGTYNIYFVGLSERQAVTSEKFTISVTNCFDEYMTFLSGAQDKADKTSKKTWKLTNHPMAFYNGMYGAWMFYDMAPGQSNYQGGSSVLKDTDFGTTMVFEIANNKLTLFDKDGKELRTGGWSASQEELEDGKDIDGGNPDGKHKVYGKLSCSVGLVCVEKVWQTFSGSKTPYYILSIDNKHMILCLPETYNRTGDAWDYDASYYFFTAEE